MLFGSEYRDLDNGIKRRLNGSVGVDEMRKIIDYCKGRIFIVLKNNNSFVNIYYRFDFSHDDFKYGIEMEITGKVLPEEVNNIDLEIRNSLPMCFDQIFADILQTIDYYIDTPELFKENEIIKFGCLEV